MSINHQWLSESEKMISIHDNHILRYSVDALTRTIVLETEFPHSSPLVRTTIIFEGVQAYLFENDLFGTIIFDIEVVDIESITSRYADRFSAGAQYGWPLGWEQRKETAAEYFTRLELKAFEISSSYGMDGWIICKMMKQVVA